MTPWNFRRFREIARVVTGNTPTKRNPDNYGGVLPWVKPGDLGMLQPITATSETISETGRINARVLPKDTVLVCCIGSVGKVGIAGTEIACNQQINALVFGESVLPRFGYYFCLANKAMFESRAAKAVVPILNKGDFQELEMPVPPLTEQTRVVEILDRAFAVRWKREAADELIDGVRDRIFARACDNESTKIPISDILESCQYGSSEKADAGSDSVPVVRMNNVRSSGWIDLSDLKFIEREAADVPRFGVRAGDLLFNRTNSRELVGKTGLWLDEREAVYASYLIRLRTRRDLMLPEFLWAHLNSPSGKQALFQLARKAIGMANINARELGALQVPVVPIERQERFAAIVHRLRRILDLQRTSHRQITALFQTLMSRAFDGRLTAKWREAHARELSEEIAHQKRAVAAATRTALQEFRP